MLDNLDTAQAVWTAFFLTAGLTGAMTVFLGWLIWKIVDYFRTWVVWWDEDAGRVEIERRKVKSATIQRGKGKKGRAYFLNAKARKTANRGAAYLIDVHSGMNYTGLSRTDTEEILNAAGIVMPAEEEQLDEEKAEEVRSRAANWVAKLKACDPEFAFNVLRTNSYKKWLKTNEGEEDWRTKIAPWALGGLIVLAIAFGWVFTAYQKVSGA